MPSSIQPSHSPASAATAILTSDTPLPDLAAGLKIPLPDLLKILTSPDAQSLIASIIQLETLRADHREARARLTGLTILEEIAGDPDADKVERRRAATAILRPSRKPDRQGGRASPPNPRPAPHDPSDPDDNADDAELDHDDEETDAESDQAPAPKPVKPPRLPLAATPDEIVANQLACIQAIDKPTPTPRDIYAALDYHHLSFHNRYYAANAIAFEQALINSPLLDIKHAELTADPATFHDTTPPTATVRVTIKHPARALDSPADAQCLMPDASCLFHLAHESINFNRPDAPFAWHTKSITRDTS